MTLRSAEPSEARYLSDLALRSKAIHGYSLVFMKALFVEPDTIGKGIGHALFEHARKKAAASGGTTMSIQGDSNAARFYESVGAVKAGERESGSIPGRFLPVYTVSLD